MQPKYKARFRIIVVKSWDQTKRGDAKGSVPKSSVDDPPKDQEHEPNAFKVDETKRRGQQKRYSKSCDKTGEKKEQKIRQISSGK